MPSSVGHALAGFAVSRFLGARLGEVWPYVIASSVADLDIVMSVARRRSIDYRNRRSHSLGAALAAGTILGGAAWLAGGRFRRHFMMGSAAYASHLALDYFGKDAENGLPLLWPLSDRHFSAEKPLFGTIYSRRGHFILGLLTRRNLMKIGREIAVIAPVVVAADVSARAIRSGRRPAADRRAGRH